MGKKDSLSREDNFFTRIGKAIKEFFSPITKKVKEKLHRLHPLVFFQLSDKLDFSWRKSKKETIQKVVFAILKFLAIVGIIAVIVWLFDFLSIIYKPEMVNLYVLFFTLIMILLLISNTHNLTQSLYYAEDNKLLVTFPVKSSTLFFSKILDFFVFDFFKNLNLLIPVTYGFAIGGIIIGQIEVITLLWLIFPLVVASAIIVLLASLLSFPYLFIYRLFKSVPTFELLTVLLIIAGLIILITSGIGLIPEDIDLVNQWPAMQKSLIHTISDICQIFYPFTFVVYSMFGKRGNTYIGYKLTSSCFFDFSILIVVFLILLFLCYVIIKPFFFKMMTRSFEFEKNIIDEPRPNKKRSKYFTFVNKELVLNIRDFDISGSFLMVYIMAPILLYFIDSVFSAISTRLGGDMMTYAFNVLLMLLPYLASNSVIATLYSREGRAAYMKKTKPMSMIFPLSSKVFVYIFLSIASIIACGFVFADFSSATNLGKLPPILLTITICCLQIAHMYYSATLDIMNPQNEIYATTGNEESNANENKSTLVAFIASGLFALIAYALMVECHLADGNYDIAFLKLLIIGVVALAACFYLFVMKVKAYYYEK